MKNLLNLILIILVIALSGALIIKKPTDSSPNSESKEETQDTMTTIKLPQPEMIIDQSQDYFVTLQTTEGDIEIELDVKNTPITANNFYYLASKNFYDNVIFHRVIKGFMIQSGDPTGTGSGGPGYKFADEKFDGQYTRGTVAMANSGPNTNGSQFFIMHEDTPLPQNYVIFGHVVSGMDVVDKIATAETVKDGGENSRPLNPVTIKSTLITIK